MTITVEVRPEVEAELARKDSMRGRPVEAYVATLLEEAVHLQPSPRPQEETARPKGGRPPGRKSLAQ